MERLITLREALSLADSSPDDAALFLPLGEAWSLDTACALSETDPYEDSEAPPKLAQDHGLGYALSVPQLQDIVSNARQQLAEPTAEQLLAAFLFYYDRDAFIDFSDGKSG